MKIHLFSILLGVAALSSCVEEYALPEDISEEYTGQIYIEGKILSGTESLVYIMKTTDMNSTANEYVHDAKVYVESEKGEKPNRENMKVMVHTSSRQGRSTASNAISL